MDYSFLDKEEYRDIPVVRIIDNKNNLPFFINRRIICNHEKHRHEFVQIMYVSKGKLKHVINSNIFDIYKGDIFIIPPFVPHYFIDEYNEKFELIEFEFIPEFINEKFSVDTDDNGFMDFAYLEPFLVVENEIKPRLNLTGNLQIEVENLLSEVIREYEEHNSNFELMVKGLLLKLLVLLGREFRKSNGNDNYQGLFDKHRDALVNAINYIHERYTEEISVDDAARVVMLSQSYFRYIFKQMTQKTFTEYITSLRINKAIELLKIRKDLKIVDICFETGFNNVHHFNRCFRQETGTTPMAYRKSMV